MSHRREELDEHPVARLEPRVGRVERRLRVQLVQQVARDQALRHEVVVQLERRDFATGGALGQIPLRLGDQVDVDDLVPGKVGGVNAECGESVL